MRSPDKICCKNSKASLETFFGLGLITGPTVGGALYQVGGYTTPFVVMGAALFLSAVMTAVVLPEHRESEIDAKTGRKLKTKFSWFCTYSFLKIASILGVLKVPGVALAACSIVATSVSIGFLQATLEPHLRQVKLIFFQHGFKTYQIIAFLRFFILWE
jgi:MFS family permease